MPVRVRISSDEPVDMEIVWKSKRARPAEGQGQTVAGCGQSATGSGQSAGSAAELRKSAGSAGSAAGSGQSAAGSEQSAAGSEADLCRPVGAGFIVAGEAHELGWVGLSTHHERVKLAKLGSVWAGRVVVATCMSLTVDMFDDRMQQSFTLFKGPELLLLPSMTRGIWFAKVEFGRWVGQGLKPFGSVGRLLSLKPISRARWDTMWQNNFTPSSIPRAEGAFYDKLPKKCWPIVVVWCWEGPAARCMNMDGDQALNLYKGDNFQDVRQPKGRFLVARLVFTYWEVVQDGGEHTSGRLLEITVLGHTKLGDGCTSLPAPFLDSDVE